MPRRASVNFVIFLVACDLALTQLSLYLACLARRHLPWGKPLLPEGTRLGPQIYGLALAIWLLTFVLLSVYNNVRVLKAVDELRIIPVAVSMASFALAGALYLSYRDLSRLLFVYFVAIDLALLLIFRLFLRLIFRVAVGRRYGTTRVLIIGAGKAGRKVGRIMKEGREAGLRLIGFLDDEAPKQEKICADLPILGGLGNTCRVVKEHKVDEVVFALPLRAHRKLVNLVIDLQRLPVNVRVVPDFFDLAFFQATTEHFGGLPLINLREPAINGYQRVVKRAFDLIVATILILFLAPLIALIALLIKLGSKGPAIFKQERVGENCKPFQMYKFRTMVPDAEERLDEVLTQTEDGEIIHKVENDPRVTRLGRFLRRMSLDELPQLFNVLKGEMSLVGPRPEMPWLVDRYEQWQLKRFSVPQGITGWWQVHGRSDRPMHLHTEDDLYYIQHWSLLLDIQILCMTIGAVLKQKGAY